MEESVLEAYKEELVIKERYYNENVKKYEKNKTKYKVLIAVNVGLIILNSYALYKLNVISEKLGDNIAGLLFDYTIYDAFSRVMLVLVIALIVLVILMYRYTHVRGEIKNGIDANDDLIIGGGNLEISAVKDGIHVKDSIRIMEATVAITAEDDGIVSENEDGCFYMESGSVNIESEDDAIHTMGDVTLAGEAFIFSRRMTDLMQTKITPVVQHTLTSVAET